MGTSTTTPLDKQQKMIMFYYIFLARPKGDCSMVNRFLQYHPQVIVSPADPISPDSGNR